MNFKRDFTSTVGVPVYFDGNEVEVDSKFLSISKKIVIGAENVKRIYINSYTVFPKTIYKIYYLDEVKPIFSKVGLTITLMTIFPEIIGIEYAKTKTFKAVSYVRVVEIIQGKGRAILTSPTLDAVFIINFDTGSKFIIPPDWFYTLVNIGKKTVFLVELHNRNDQSTECLKGYRGAPFYIIERNSSKEVVKNSRYKNIREYATLDMDVMSKYLDIAPKTAIIKQFLRKYEKFAWFYDPSAIDWPSVFGEYTASRRYFCSG